MFRCGQSIVVGFFVLLLVGCGDEGDTNAKFSGPGATSSSGTASGTGEVVTVSLGSGSGSSFQSGVLELGLSSISAGGKTTVTATLVDADGNLYTQESVDVKFSSDCTGKNLATLESPVPSTDGYAISTYQAQGCAGEDTIKALAIVNETTITATATITVAPPSAGEINFVSANPTDIGLKGSGLEETSIVQFIVKDGDGNPIPNQDVNFSIDIKAGGALGGLSFSPQTDTSDANGIVQTTVRSGTVPVTVIVNAALATKPAIATGSRELVVSTGIPDYDSFDLSATVLNPEAWDYSGVTVEVTARLADRFNNLVPDGTPVYFTTEGGAIESNCRTVDGACTVTWTSQEPRPCGETLGGTTDVTLAPNLGPGQCVSDNTGTNPAVPQTGPAPLGQPYGGRSTIAAYTVGEESFNDANGNGIFDDGDTHTDLGEPYLDIDEDGAFDSVSEEIFDYKGNGTRQTADGEFNGVLCNRSVAPLCSTETGLYISRSLVLVMSGATSHVDVLPKPLVIPKGGTLAGSVVISDLHNQPMPAETKVSIVSTVGSITTGGSYKFPATSDNRATELAFVVEGNDENKSGLFTVETETPKGLITRHSFPIREGSWAELGATLADSTDPVGDGGSTAYTLTLTNTNGPSAAKDVTATFELPSELALGGPPTASQGSCSGTGPIVCSLGSIAVGASATVNLPAKDANSGDTDPLALTSTTVTLDSSSVNTGDTSISEYTEVD